MSITSLTSRLAFAVLLIVTAFAAAPSHAQHGRGAILGIDVSANR